MKQLSFRITIALIASATLTFAQNANQAAVDTLTKDVAKAVFSIINQPKAQEIYIQLMNCGDGCDPQQVIRDVGSWDQIGAKMQELSELKNTQKFQAMSPAEANTAIRKQLARFYTTHKAEKPYSVPLSPTVQAQILTKIDGLLPPANVAEPSATGPIAATISQPVSDEETDIPATTLQISRLEIQVKHEQEKQFWLILVSAFVGFVIGIVVGYSFMARTLKNKYRKPGLDSPGSVAMNDSSNQR